MFEVGQKVWCVMFGEGVVTDIDKGYTYPLIVKFTNGVKKTYALNGKENESHVNPSLYPYPVEIVRKVTKPSIDWKHVRKDFKFLAQDIDGNAWLYWEKPVLGENGWQTTQGDCAEAQQFASYTPGTCRWEYSLVERP